MTTLTLLVLAFSCDINFNKVLYSSSVLLLFVKIKMKTMNIISEKQLSLISLALQSSQVQVVQILQPGFNA